MKWLFYLLVLANLAFFAWDRTVAPGKPAPNAMTAQPRAGGARLVLLRELPPSKRPPARKEAMASAAREKPGQEGTPSVASVSGPVHSNADHGESESATAAAPAKKATPAAADRETLKAPAPVCYRVGGIADAKIADALSARLKVAGATILKRGTETGTQSNYWVFLPAFPSQQAAWTAIRRLQQHGFRDYYLVRSGENENAVSLGVFSDRARASERYREIRGFGLKPRLDELVTSSQDYFLTFRWSASKSDKPLAEVLGDLQTGRPVASPCP